MDFKRYNLLTNTLYSLNDMIKNYRDCGVNGMEFITLSDQRANIVEEFYKSGYIDKKEYEMYLLRDDPDYLPFINIPEEFAEKAIEMHNPDKPIPDVKEKCMIRMVTVKYTANAMVYDYGERNIYSGPFEKPAMKPEHFFMNIELNPDYIKSEHEVIIGRFIKSSFKNFQDFIEETLSKKQ